MGRSARLPDRNGRPAGKGVYYPALSPDGHYVAVETMENENLDVWVVDISRGTRIRLTSDPAAEILPAWAPEGDAVAFSSYRTGNTDIFVRPADARIEERPIANTPASERVSDWSRDGQYVLYSVESSKKRLRRSLPEKKRWRKMGIACVPTDRIQRKGGEILARRPVRRIFVRRVRSR